jgi:hypothetical protein
MLPGDSRERWAPTLLTDPRVVHYWDTEAEIGRYFGQNQEAIGFTYFSGAIVWDAYLLFGPEAQWTDVPTPLESFGFTVLADKDDLAQAVARIWAAQ